MDKVTKNIEALKVDSSTTPKNGAPGPAPPATGALPFSEDDMFKVLASMPQGPRMTVDETVAEMKQHPIFMTDMSDLQDAEDNIELAALQALAYDGTPLENATNFKEQGNECFRAKKWADAKEFYTKGIALLTAEEKKRASKEIKDANASSAPKDTPEDTTTTTTTTNLKDAPPSQDPSEISAELSLLETLHLNRAACHLSLQNFRSCTLDCASTLRLNPSNIKALYRSSRALLSLDKLSLASDACTHGLSLDPSNTSLLALQSEISSRSATLSAKSAADEARLSQSKSRARLLKTALAARGIITRSTGEKPEMEDAKVELVPNPDDPTSELSFPTLLLYPLQNDMDFIKGFQETQTLEQHFEYVFPTPWDREGVYTTAGVECYMETAGGGTGLVKVGKKVPLLKVLSGGKVEVVDELVRVYVVPKGKAEGWIREFKEKKGAMKK